MLLSSNPLIRLVKASPLHSSTCLRALSNGKHIDTPSTSEYDLSLRARKGFGLFHSDIKEDIAYMTDNYTAPALARALREREDTLHVCAQMAVDGDFKTLLEVLDPFLKRNVQKRQNKKYRFYLSDGFKGKNLSVIQKHLHRMPRQVLHAADRRASGMTSK